MLVRKITLALTIVMVTTASLAQSLSKPSDAATSTERSGSAEDQAACRPDVRKFCHKLEADAGDLIFLTCLKEHRDTLRKACNDVLNKHWQ